MYTYCYIQTVEDQQPIVKVYRLRNNVPYKLGHTNVGVTARLSALNLLQNLFGYRHDENEITRGNARLVEFD